MGRVTEGFGRRCWWNGRRNLDSLHSTHIKLFSISEAGTDQLPGSRHTCARQREWLFLFLWYCGYSKFTSVYIIYCYNTNDFFGIWRCETGPWLPVRGKNGSNTGNTLVSVYGAGVRPVKRTTGRSQTFFRSYNPIHLVHWEIPDIPQVFYPMSVSVEPL